MGHSKSSIVCPGGSGSECHPQWDRIVLLLKLIRPEMSVVMANSPLPTCSSDEVVTLILCRVTTACRSMAGRFCLVVSASAARVPVDVTLAAPNREGYVPSPIPAMAVYFRKLLLLFSIELILKVIRYFTYCLLLLFRQLLIQ